jgi:hypothetical protein
MVAGGLGGLVHEALEEAYDALFVEGLAFVSQDVWLGMRTPLVVAVVGAAAWWWHWLRYADRDESSTLRLVYLFLFGILGGAGASLTAAGLLLYAVLEWSIGVPDTESAARHFELIPGVLATLLVGAGSWGYHRAVQRERPPSTVGVAAGERSGPERVYRYLLAAAGLFTLAGGLLALFAMAIDIATPDPRDLVRDASWWRNQLAAAITLLLIGAPLWARYWWDAQRHAPLGGEREALSRRVFLFGVFGVAALATLINLVILLFRFFDDWLEGELGWAVLHDTRWSIAILLTAGAAGVYYWLVLREDQRALGAAEAAPAAVRAREVLLFAPGDARALAAELERRLGARVRTQRRLDRPDGVAPLSEEQVGRVVQSIQASDGARVAVILEVNGGAQVVPYAPAGR